MKISVLVADMLVLIYRYRQKNRLWKIYWYWCRYRLDPYQSNSTELSVHCYRRFWLQSPKPKLNWRACFSSNYSNHTPTQPTWKSKDNSLCQALSKSQTNLGLHRTYIFPKMEDDLNFFKKGIRPQFFRKRKTNFFQKLKTTLILKMED